MDKVTGLQWDNKTNKSDKANIKGLTFLKFIKARTIETLLILKKLTCSLKTKSFWKQKIPKAII